MSRHFFQQSGRVFLLMWWLVSTLTLAAQEVPPLTPLAEVHRLLTDPSQATAVPTRFAGTVVFVSRVGDICVQEGDAGLFVEPPADLPRLHPGDRVEVTADIGFRTADLLKPDFFVQAREVRTTGHGELPAPESIWLTDGLRGAYSGRHVVVEGVLMQATVQDGLVVLHLTDRSGWAVINVHEWKPGVTTRDWWGAKLRIRAANIGRGHSALRVTSSDDIEVLRPGTDDCFAAPMADATALRTSGATADRLRVVGTILAMENDWLYVRSDAGPALRASWLAPYPPTNPPHPLELLAPPRPEGLRAGDRVELVGSPLGVPPRWHMAFSSVRALPAGAAPVPVEVGAGRVEEFGCDLVTLSGRLLWLQEGAESRLALDCGGTTVHALAATGTLPQQNWQAGDVIRATGVLIPAENGQPFLLRVNAASTVRRLSDPGSNWRALTPLARRWVATLGVGLVAALLGAWWLQRLVRQRTAALQAEVAVRVKAEEDLARALEQERELGELKSRFVSMVSHEFRTPLGITMSAVELLQHYEDRLPPEQKTELLADIQRSTKNMADLMEQVLLLGRVEAGRLGFRPHPIDLDALARKLTDESLSATHRRCPIAWSTENDVSDACGDDSLLRHIVSNLLSNAVKYSPEGVTVHFAARREGESAVLTVRDDGIGIPPEDRARLFEAFHRCTNVGEIPGTGLGLVIVKRCVDLHRGTIDVESEPGRGTTFTVRLPLWPAA